MNPGDRFISPQAHLGRLPGNSVIAVLTYGGILRGQLMSGAVITAAAVILLNLLVDLSYLVLDPQVKDALASGKRT